MVLMPAGNLSMQNTLVDVQPSANTPPTPKSASQVSTLRRPLGTPAMRHVLAKLEQGCICLRA